MALDSAVVFTWNKRSNRKQEIGQQRVTWSKKLFFGSTISFKERSGQRMV